MEYQANHLPYGLFEKIGMSKKEVLSLPADDLKALLQGRTTRMLDLNFKMEGIDLREKAKISLYTLADNSVGIKIHPYRKELQNEYGFSASEMGMLKKGEVLAKTKVSLNGEKEKYLFQLDQDINEIKSVRVKDIHIPKFIEGHELTRGQKEELRKGASVILAGEKIIRVDLLHANGYTVEQAKTRAVSATLPQEKSSTSEENKTRTLDNTKVASLQPDKAVDIARMRTNEMHR